MAYVSKKEVEELYSVSNLEAQSSSSMPKTINTGIRKILKPRNKKVKDEKIWDIIEVDREICECFENEKKNLPELKIRITEMLTSLSKMEIPDDLPQDIVKGIEEIKKDDKWKDLFKENTEITVKLFYRQFLIFYDTLCKKITKYNNISSGILLQKYKKLVNSDIEQWQLLLSIPVTTSFCAPKKKDPHTEKRKQILQHYLSIASDFVKLEGQSYSQNDTSSVNACNCGNATEWEDNDGFRTCTNCGKDQPKICDQTSFKDNERVNLNANRYRYEKRSYFKECLMQYQGKQKSVPDDTFYEKCDEWLSNNGLLTEGKTRKEKYSKLKKEHIRLFMSESRTRSITRHYLDLNLIYSKLTGTPCPDVSHLEETLYQQFDKLVEAFLSLEDINRTNFLNSSYVLSRLLQLNHYNYDPDDFPGLKTITRQQEHDELWDQMIELAGINDPLSVGKAYTSTGVFWTS